MVRITYLLIAIVSLSSCVSQDVAQEKTHINQFLDNWHNAAATANEEVFFGSFTDDGIYIGTDETEHWKATELQQWAKSAFEKDVAWAFRPYNRHIYFSDDKHTVWFDELLDTWMGPCRGSGVLSFERGQWKIAHYHLSVAVPNEVIDEYLKLLPQDKIKSK